MAAFRAFAHGVGPLGPPIRALTFDPDARIETIRADFVQGLTDTDRWTNLSSFRAMAARFYSITVFPIRGSPLLTHGTIGNAAAANGAAFTDASRFYMVPGMGHCGGGNAFDTFDLLGAVVDWVEKATRPRRSPPIAGRAPTACRYALSGFAQFGGTPGRFTCAPR
jgi:feruloyl esterase